MSSYVPSYSSARSEVQNNNILTSEVDKIQAKLSDLSKDLEKFAPEYRSQVMVDRLRQQKLRAMISLAKAQHYLAETDVLIADYNLQAVAEEFEHMKKERYLNSSDMKPQNLGSKEEKLASTDSPASSGNHKDTVSCSSFPPAVGKSKSKEKSNECTPKLSTHLVDACILRSKTDIFTPILKNIQPINKIDGSETTSNVTKASCKSYEPTTSKTYKESSSKTKESSTSKPKESKHKEATASKTKEDSTSKTKESTTSKTKEATTSKTKEDNTSKTKESTTSKTKEATISKAKEDTTSKHKEATTSKTKEDNTSKNKESTTSKTKEDNTSKTKESTISKTKEATISKAKEDTTSKTKEADTDLPATGRKSKKRKRSRSKSKESKRHKSSHKHEKSSHATVTASNASAESTVASSNVNIASLEPVASSNMHTALLGSAASSIIHTAFTRALASTSFVPAASSFVPGTSSFMPAATSYVPERDYLKSNRTTKEKTLLNTSISPIKKIVEAKGVQTDKKASKNDVVQTDVVQRLTKGVQTDNVIILQIGSDTVRVLPPDIADEDTLLLDTLPIQHSHSAAICLAKALQEINSQKSSAPIRLCPTEPDVSRVLSQNEVLQKIEVIVEDEDAAEENPVAVKMEVPDGDFPNTSTEILVNNLYKDIMKEKVQKASNMEPKGNVTKRELWKILDEC